MKDFILHINKVQDRFGVSRTDSEKVVRIFSVLAEIQKDSELKNSLVFIGGTALNFGIFAGDPPRLSYDLDFNFREFKPIISINEVMQDVQISIQRLLQALGYFPEDVEHKSFFELDLFRVFYRRFDGIRDFFKIDICYSRRIPLLRNKSRLTNVKIVDIEVETRQSAPEEICGEKIAAAVKRKLSRDVFDVYMIAKSIDEGLLDFNLLRKCAFICILYQDIDPRTQDWKTLFDNLSLDSYLESALINKNRITRKDSSTIVERATNILTRIFSNFTKVELKYLDYFFKKSIFNPKLIDSEKIFHPRLEFQSEMNWVLSKRSKKRNKK